MIPSRADLEETCRHSTLRQLQRNRPGFAPSKTVKDMLHCMVDKRGVDVTMLLDGYLCWGNEACIQDDVIRFVRAGVFLSTEFHITLRRFWHAPKDKTKFLPPIMKTFAIKSIEAIIWREKRAIAPPLVPSRDPLSLNSFASSDFTELFDGLSKNFHRGEDNPCLFRTRRTKRVVLLAPVAEMSSCLTPRMRYLAMSSCQSHDTISLSFFHAMSAVVARRALLSCYPPICLLAPTLLF